MIQINPLKSYIDGGVRAALTTPPSASLVFDLPGKAIWVKGVKLKGTDHTYIFNHDNYITLTNTPDKNNPESEDIKIGVNITTLKNAIDTTYNGGTLALLQEGINTEERTWQAKILHNYINDVLPTTKNLKINGTNYAVYTTENSLPQFFAPVSLGTTGQILACTSSGLSWIDQIQNTDYRVSQSSTTSNSDYRIILKQGANNNPETDFVRFSEYLTFNPYTKTLKINNIKVVTATDIYTGSTAGLIPAATSEQQNYYLRGDGAWVNIATEMAAANTWRPIKVGNTDALGSGTNTGTLSFIAGTGIALSWDATNKRIIITNSSPDVNHNTDENVRQVPKTDDVNRPLMMINGSTSAGEQINTSMFSTGIYANASTKMITANGFIKAGSSNNYVLLGGGSHKAISDFSMSGHTHAYLPLSGGTMTLGEGLKFHADNNYFGTDSDARIISLLDGNDTVCDGGLIIDERATYNGTEYVTELLRIRHSEFKWRGQNILHSGNYNNYTPTLTGTGASGTWNINISGNADTVDGYHASSFSLSTHTHTFNLGNTTITTNSGSYSGITGPFNIYTNANAANAFSIWRSSAAEGVRHWVDDDQYHIDYTNDETSSSIHIRIINTDTESGNKTNTTDYHYYLDCYGNFYHGSNNTGSIGTSSSKWANMYATTFHGSLDGNATSARHLLINGVTWNSNWHWSGQGGQPSWLWGSNDGVNMYVWNPSNFSVNYANSAGSVAWNNITNKPINFKAYSGSLASGGWKIMQGNNSSPSIAIAYNNGAASWNSGTYSATLVYGCSDTRGLLDCSYYTPVVTFGGCSYGGANDDNPTWYMKLSGTHGVTYNLNSMPYASSAGNADTVDGLHYNSFLRKDTNDSTPYQYTFTKTDDHAIRVGTVRGTAVGSQTGEYIHLYERVAIGSPSGWGSRPAPSYGLATYGGAWLATDTGNVGIGTTGPVTKLDIRGTDRVSMLMDTANAYRFSTGFKGTLYLGHATHGSGSGVNDGYTDGITFGVNGAAYAGIIVQNSGSYGSRILFTTTDDYSYNKARMILNAQGKLGILTMSPSYTLDVNGTTRSTNRIYANEWIQFDNYTGLYSPNNNAHFYPNNTTSFGQWQLRGNRNSYSGIHFGDSTYYMTIMDSGTHKGLYSEGWGQWILYFNQDSKQLGLRTSSLTGYAVTCDGDFYCRSGWLRTEGSTGWYNESYGGGWHMTDSTYIRVYGSKRVYNDNTSQYAFYTSGGMTALGHMWSSSSAQSWLDGQRAETAALNIAASSNTGSYWPWFRQTLTAASKWISVGTLSTSLYFIGSTTSRTANSYDYGFVMNFSNGAFTSSGSVYATHFYENSDIRYKKILNNLLIDSNTIANLPLFDFEWIENNTIGTGTSAQAVQQILPNLVSGTNKLTLDYGVLGTIAGITACKELVTQKSELQQLKEKVKQLEDKLRKYENTL